MKVQLWGVRGSIPSPGPETAGYGGNTSCVSVTLRSGTTVILDAGSGIRALGKALLTGDGPIQVLLSHLHWDHIQGLPFFAPMYGVPGRVELNLPSEDWPARVRSIMDGVHYFPMAFEALPGQPEIRKDGIVDALADHGVAVTRIRANHPGLCFGYRLEAGGSSLVYLPDNELLAERAPTTLGQFVDFCRHADLLIHDCQFRDDEIAAKRGWGHSSTGEVTDIAIKANVKRLVLFHHDPFRSDAAVDELHQRAIAHLENAESPPACDAAREGTVYRLNG